MLDEVGHARVPPVHARLDRCEGMKHMLDVAFVILGAVLFLGALIYARACANV